MHVFVRHVALPAAAPAALVALYFTPVAVFGCVNRGLMALAVVLISAVAAFVTITLGFRARARGESPFLWLITSLILTSSLVLILKLG
jgi:ABC-type transport system involved in cytochrome c biogenesis permease subunit